MCSTPDGDETTWIAVDVIEKEDGIASAVREGRARGKEPIVYSLHRRSGTLRGGTPTQRTRMLAWAPTGDTSKCSLSMLGIQGRKVEQD